MKHFYPFRWLIPAAFLCFMAMPVQAQLQLPRASQMASVSQQVGISHVKITYSRPAVAEREIWGSLVPYGMNNLGFGTAAESPWRAGANENTVFKVDQDAMVEGQPLPAGTYGLHMIIHEDDKATIIFSKNSGAWGSYFYDPAEDALRVDVSSREAPHAEQLTYLLSEVTPTSVVASLRWGTKEIPFTVSFDTPEIASGLYPPVVAGSGRIYPAELGAGRYLFPEQRRRPGRGPRLDRCGHCRPVLQPANV